VGIAIESIVHAISGHAILHTRPSPFEYKFSSIPRARSPLDANHRQLCTQFICLFIEQRVQHATTTAAWESDPNTRKQQRPLYKGRDLGCEVAHFPPQTIIVFNSRPNSSTPPYQFIT
jgi:hypothetical protein